VSKTASLSQFAFVGHAIVSSDGKIADANGGMPPEMFVEADWKSFQAALDDSDLVVLGRKGHARHPNPGRNRLVLTSSVDGLVPDTVDQLAHLWNPATLSLETMLTDLSLSSGSIAITGGQSVFDYFAPYLTAFDLVECPDVELPGGVDCFSSGMPKAVLSRLGLKPEMSRTYDADRNVTATLWRRP